MLSRFMFQYSMTCLNTFNAWMLEVAGVRYLYILLMISHRWTMKEIVWVQYLYMFLMVSRRASVGSFFSFALSTGPLFSSLSFPSSSWAGRAASVAISVSAFWSGFPVSAFWSGFPVSAFWVAFPVSAFWSGFPGTCRIRSRLPAFSPVSHSGRRGSALGQTYIQNSHCISLTLKFYQSGTSIFCWTDVFDSLKVHSQSLHQNFVTGSHDFCKLP